jgi:hypothetical protein
MRQVVLIALPALALFALVLEIVLRAGGYVPYYLSAAAFVPSGNPALLYALRPNFQGLYAGNWVSINSEGLRGRELAQEGTLLFRVALLGDSVAFGQGVDEDRTLPAQLAVRLQRKLGSHAEVANLGVPGYDTCQELLRFREAAARLKPRVAILLYLDNDTEASLITVKDSAVISADVRTGLIGGFMAAMRKHSYAYNLVWSNWQIVKRRPSTVREYGEIVAQRFGADSPGWRRSKACFAELVSLARAQSIRLIVIPFPPMPGLRERPYPFEPYISAVCGEARRAGVECLDVVSALQDPGLRLAVSHIEGHPSAEVYARVAEQVAKMLP